jgi:N-acetyl-1-D-myo-inositol-2-amino-2-deoxy-alpha-D-glucopyranoside deacetylase
VNSLGLVCLHAHPDDEAIATGGSLARYAAEGVRTAVITCTGGERGEIYNMDEAQTRPRLAEVRLAELTAALDRLGAGPPRMLGYVDSGMAGTDGNDDPASFWRADFDEAVGRLVAMLRELRPDVFVTYDAFGGYGHPDHVQTHRIGLVAAEACGKAEVYPDAGPAWRIRKVYFSTIAKSWALKASRELVALGLPSPFGDDIATLEDVGVGTHDDELDAVVDVGAHLATKMAALREHVSQLDRASFFLNMPEDLEGRAFGVEAFVRLRSDVAVPAVEDDLFTGLR